MGFSDGGAQTVTETDGGATVDASDRLEVSGSVGLTGVRVRLFDWTDAVVESDDEVERSDAGFSYRMQLSAPLKAGRRYSLLVDGESADRFVDAFGREHDEWRMAFRVAGEVERPAAGPAPKPNKKKRR